MKDFVFDSALSIYVHPQKPPIDYSDGGEEYLLNIFKNLKDIKSYDPELLTHIKDWASRYHLSLRRTNIMEAVAEIFNKDSDVLELGSGCGAITRWLGENFRSVDAVEGSMARAQVTRERTRDLANVNIFCGDMLDISCQPNKYRLVTLNGVMEYLPYYMSAEDPKKSCIDYLKRLNTAIEEDGILLIAIENKLGAKYFSGCSEDHSKLFEGLIGYPNKTPVTFSRNELQEMLSTSGFNNIQFYHTFPDYKLPETFFRESDETLSLYPYNWIRTPFEDYSGGRFNIIPEPLLLKSLTQSGLLWHFSNSFLVLAGKSNKINLQTEWLIKKFFNNDAHKPIFHHTVALNKDRNNDYVVKRELICPNETNPAQQDIGFNLTETDRFISGELLLFDAYKGLMSDAPAEAIIKIMKEIHDNILLNYHQKEVDEHGYHLVDENAVDFVFWNLIKSSDGKLHFIDRKWSFKEKIPADFVLFRGLWGVYGVFAPFIKQKDLSLWIIDIIKNIYPAYDMERFKKNIRLEESFQSTVSTCPVTIDLSKYQPQYAMTEYIHPTDLNRQLAEKNKQIESLMNSYSWKVTAPLRRVLGLFKK